MKILSSLFAVLSIILISSCGSAPGVSQKQQQWAIVVHGGAGDLTKEVLGSAMESQYRASLKAALEKGKKILASGGTSLDAVETVIRTMENDSLFNAGRGAVFSHYGRNELDASIMDGSNIAAGAVASVTDIKNPISAARAVMEKSPYVMLCGAGASEFARLQGLDIVPPEYFRTQKKWSDLQEMLKKELKGTVGCVALDKKGNLAAGTSTGGMAGKNYNRIGDSPVIGAGTYAKNATCAISCTGHGEFFIRYAVAHDISALMEYKGLSLEQAAKSVITDKLMKIGGQGGVIGVDRKGNVTMTFNTEGMFRAFAKSDGTEGVAIFNRDGGQGTRDK